MFADCHEFAVLVSGISHWITSINTAGKDYYLTIRMAVIPCLCAINGKYFLTKD